MHACVRACAHVRVRVRVCVRACVCTCVCVCLRACMGVRACVHACGTCSTVVSCSSSCADADVDPHGDAPRCQAEKPLNFHYQGPCWNDTGFVFQARAGPRGERDGGYLMTFSEGGRKPTAGKRKGAGLQTFGPMVCAGLRHVWEVMGCVLAKDCCLVHGGGSVVR